MLQTAQQRRADTACSAGSVLIRASLTKQNEVFSKLRKAFSLVERKGDDDSGLTPHAHAASRNKCSVGELANAGRLVGFSHGCKTLNSDPQFCKLTIHPHCTCQA